MSPRNRPRPAVALVCGAVLGALTWAAWLGWDRTPSYDVVTGTVQTPYVTLQVLGCALTVGVVTGFLAARSQPVAAALGVGLGFWVAWTLWAASTDGSGLYAVGSMMLAIGLALGTTIAAYLGVVVQTAWDRRPAARDNATARAAGGRANRRMPG